MDNDGKEMPVHTLDTGRLTVIGTGYLGVTHAACMASLGFHVLGNTLDPQRWRSAGWEFLALGRP